VVATRSLTLRRVSLAATSRRESFPRLGVQLRVSSGPLAGYWVSEVPGLTYRTGSYAGLRYLRERTAAVVSPQVVGVALRGRAGRPVQLVRETLPRGTRMSVDVSAYLDGRLHAHVISGALAGYWVPLSQLAWA
jgi:hypothetical protein